MRKKIAIVGSGISGMTSAYHLNKDYDVTIYEAADYIGGHTNTIEVDDPDLGKINIDTGFIVFNDWTYDNFIKMLGDNSVESEESPMSFAVKCQETGLEYNGTNLNTLFAQRINLFKPRFWRMILDILRFNKAALLWLESADQDDATTLGDFLINGAYSNIFIEQYAWPMTSAIWSSSRQGTMNFPFRFFVQFFKNHGMLSVDDRPTWRVIKGGSKSYIPAFTKKFSDRIRLSSPVERIQRKNGRILLTAHGETENYDAVILACHSDQALNILAEDATDVESEILSAFPYQDNEAVLHWDETVLPQNKLAWAAWVYHRRTDKNDRAALSYNMNILQNLETRRTYCVTLNHSENIDTQKILKTIHYTHPVFTLKGIKAQKRYSEISGQNNTVFAGAYWRYGFHEDGVISGIMAADTIRSLFS